MSNDAYKYVIRASTSKQCRDEIVNWLRNEATRYSSRSRMAMLKGVKKTLSAKSEAYEDAANFIERITIEACEAVAAQVDKKVENKT